MQIACAVAGSVPEYSVYYSYRRNPSVVNTDLKTTAVHPRKTVDLINLPVQWTTLRSIMRTPTASPTVRKRINLVCRQLIENRRTELGCQFFKRVPRADECRRMTDLAEHFPLQLRSTP